MPRLNAVTIDLWDTLITEVPRKNPSLGHFRVGLMHDELKALGFNYNLKVIEKAYSQSGEFCDEVWSRNKDMPMDDHFLFMLSCIDHNLPWKLKKDGMNKLKEAYSEAIMQMPPVLLPDAKEALEDLSGKGYKLGLISNTGRTPGTILRQLLEQLEIDQYFDFMTFSNEVFVRKPEKKIFLHTLRGLKTIPRLSLHVGDDLEADFNGAKKVGMKALLLDGNPSAQSNGETIHSLIELKKIL